MNTVDYENQFQEIIDKNNNSYPYNIDEYVDYVKLNQARIKRWYKKGEISSDLSQVIKNIDQPLNWVLITEPWCGDAANAHAFIVKIAELNEKINLTIQNRDASDSEIDKYLTNGGKAIPILIVRDANNDDLFRWGPRPKKAQEIVIQQKDDESLSLEEKKKMLQVWYNKDKGVSFQEELQVLLSQIK